MSFFTSPRFASFVLLACAAAGCDSQAGDGYEGEPLAMMFGTVTSDLDDTPANMEAVLLWNVEAGSEVDHIHSERVAVSSQFPAEFQMELFEPPVDDALNQFQGESRFGIAYILALPADYEVSDEEPEVAGAAERHVLAYVETDIEPGTTAERILGAPLEAGYHLLTWMTSDEPACAERHEGVYDCLLPEPDGFDAEVNVQIVGDVDELPLPDWI
jgi:hypothetical protein